MQHSFVCKITNIYSIKYSYRQYLTYRMYMKAHSCLSDNGKVSSISESRNVKREYFYHLPNLGFLSSMRVSSENKY